MGKSTLYYQLCNYFYHWEFIETPALKPYPSRLGTRQAESYGVRYEAQTFVSSVFTGKVCYMRCGRKNGTALVGTVVASTVTARLVFTTPLAVFQRRQLLRYEHIKPVIRAWDATAMRVACKTVVNEGMDRRHIPRLYTTLVGCHTRVGELYLWQLGIIKIYRQLLI